MKYSASAGGERHRGLWNFAAGSAAEEGGGGGQEEGDARGFGDGSGLVEVYWAQWGEGGEIGVGVHDREVGGVDEAVKVDVAEEPGGLDVGEAGGGLAEVAGGGGEVQAVDFAVE